jgi:hypothetical protein
MATHDDVESLPLASLTRERAVQACERIDPAWVGSLAAVMEEGGPAAVPPVLPDCVSRMVAGCNLKTTYLLVDGNHRVEAAAPLGWWAIRAVVKKGTYQEALDAAAEANAGALQKPLTHKERARLAVAMCRRHPDWSHTVVAQRLGLGSEAVDKLMQAERMRAAVDPEGKNTLPAAAGAPSARRPPSTSALAEAALAHKWTTAQLEQVIAERSGGKGKAGSAAAAPSPQAPTQPSPHLAIVSPAPVEPPPLGVRANSAGRVLARASVTPCRPRGGG